ncbi:unnamed protein product [Coffea canephora]|uniref:Ribosomal protein L23 n=1 Tax=Coffea canephora TaxID=49390 RepID=A0A068V4Y8_COFCA|nr:unnamed protein product [Coffea canephora]
MCSIYRQKYSIIFNVKLESIRRKIKHWIELLFGANLITVNRHQLPKKGRRMGPFTR